MGVVVALRRIQLRRGTAAQWASANPVLGGGEVGRELDTGKWKVGDGVTTWVALPYEEDGGGATTSTAVTGLALDGVTNDGPRIQQVLDQVALTGRPTDVLIEAPTGNTTAALYINSIVQVDSDWTRLVIRVPVRRGPNGRLRIMGETVETPATGKPVLTANVAEGGTVLPLNNTAPFLVGDLIVIRGERDASGKALQRFYTAVTAVSPTSITVSPGLDDDYQASYSNGSESRVTKVIASALTASAARGDRTVTVTNSGLFPVGALVHVTDQTRTTGTNGLPERSNYPHRELAFVVAVPSPTSLRLSHALHHPYDATQGARVALVKPVIGSSIEGAHVTGTGTNTGTLYGFEIRYGLDCFIRDCTETGTAAGSWSSQAFRLTDSYACSLVNVAARNPQVVTSGKGYGVTLYGATHCRVDGADVASTRHGLLFFNGASGNTVRGFTSTDCRISDVDFHGGQCVDNHVDAPVVVGGDSAAPDAVNKAAIRFGNTSHIDGDSYNRVTNPTITNYAGAAVDFLPSGTGNEVTGARVDGALIGVKARFLTAVPAILTTDSRVSGEFNDVTTPVQVDGGASATIRGLDLTGSVFRRPGGGLTVTAAHRVRLDRTNLVDVPTGSTAYALTATNCLGLKAVDCDWSGSYRGVKLTNCPEARVHRITLHDLLTGGGGVVLEDAGGNTGMLAEEFRTYGYTPTTTISGAGPSTGRVDIARAYVQDDPRDRGLVEWTFPPTETSSGTGQAATSGTLHVLRIVPRRGGQVANIVVGLGAIGATLTAAAAGLYDAAGTRVADCGDLTALWTGTTGLKTMPLSATVQLLAGRSYYIGLLAVGATGPAFVRGSTAVTVPNVGLSGATLRFSTGGTGLSAAPASFTPTALTGTGAIAYWAALS